MMVVIDYGMGNLGSVAKALTFLGYPVMITGDPEKAAAADQLILPGVGAMEYAMRQLGQRGLDRAIAGYLGTGRPFLGICLGMQLMFEKSEEGSSRGLGLLRGSVRRFPAQPGLKIPHMGWNQLQDSRLAILPEGGSFYFVHSYYVQPEDISIAAAWSTHGCRFCAAVQKRQILLTQFHPEKSGDAGLRLLGQWASSSGGAGLMIIYPAIDLLGGQCVRLRQGRYDQVTVYHQDPLAVALEFQAAGAPWLHIVDLDAARTGVPVHSEMIASIRRETGLKIQTGGGIRNLPHLRFLLEDLRIERVVLGTAAVRDRPFLEKVLQLYPDRIVIGIDARDSEVSIDGWTHGSGLKVLDFARMMAQAGARTAVFTDISRDGMLAGPAVGSIRNMVECSGLSIIASGGIGSGADIEAVRQTGAAGVIVGKAIYEGKVDIKQCWQKE